MPQHGFARTSSSKIVASNADNAEKSLVLRWVGRSPSSIWNDGLHLDFELRRLGDSLWMELHTANEGSTPVPVGAALHTYFSVTDAHGVRIDELKGLTFKDKTRAFEQRVQSEELVVSGEVDRVYLPSPRSHVARDRVRSRGID